MGSMRYESNRERFKVATESLFAIKEVKIGGVEDLYIKRFNSSAKEFAKNEAQLKTITALPRYALEAIAFGGMVLVLLVFLMIRMACHKFYQLLHCMLSLVIVFFLQCRHYIAI